MVAMVSGIRLRAQGLRPGAVRNDREEIFNITRVIIGNFHLNLIFLVSLIKSSNPKIKRNEKNPELFQINPALFHRWLFQLFN
jgi:hypothetical protein